LGSGNNDGWGGGGKPGPPGPLPLFAAAVIKANWNSRSRACCSRMRRYRSDSNEGFPRGIPPCRNGVRVKSNGFSEDVFDDDDEGKKDVFDGSLLPKWTLRRDDGDGGNPGNDPIPIGKKKGDDDDEFGNGGGPKRSAFVGIKRFRSSDKEKFAKWCWCGGKSNDEGKSILNRWDGDDGGKFEFDVDLDEAGDGSGGGGEGRWRRSSTNGVFSSRLIVGGFIPDGVVVVGREFFIADDDDEDEDDGVGGW